MIDQAERQTHFLKPRPYRQHRIFRRSLRQIGFNRLFALELNNSCDNRRNSFVPFLKGEDLDFEQKGNLEYKPRRKTAISGIPSILPSYHQAYHRQSQERTEEMRIYSTVGRGLGSLIPNAFKRRSNLEVLLESCYPAQLQSILYVPPTSTLLPTGLIRPLIRRLVASKPSPMLNY